MGLGGGGSSGPSREQLDLQRRQAQLEEQRLNLQQQAAQRNQQELELLRQQVQEQNRVGQANILAFQKQTEALQQGQLRLNNILDAQVDEQERQAEAAADERLRAQINSRRSQDDATANVLTQQIAATRFAQRRRAAPVASVLDPR